MAKKLIRESWRPRSSFGSWLIVKRLVATLIVLALLAGFLYFVISPFFAPNTYLVYLTAGDYLTYQDEEPTGGEPIEFVWEDFVGLAPLESALARNAQAPLVLDLLESPRSLEKQIESLREADLKRNDTLILHVTAHGLVEGGEPYLKCCSYDPADPEKGRIRVADLLQEVAKLRPATKLLILDAGREEDSLRSGMLFNSFPRHLQTAVKDLGDDSVWVLSANSSMEVSHVSHGLRRSVFGYFLANGLRGDANLDGDKELRLDELFQYVRSNVSKWVEQATDGNTTQTPVLLHANVREQKTSDGKTAQSREPPQGDRERGAGSSPRLLSLERLAPHEPVVEQDLKVAQSPDANSSVIAKVYEYATNFVGGFGLSRIVVRAEEAVKAVGSVAAGGADKSAGQAEGDEAAADGESETSSGEEVGTAGESSSFVSGELSARRRLVEAWKLASRLEDAAGHADLMQRLLWYDRLHRAGSMIDQQAVDAGLATIVRQMKLALAIDPSSPGVPLPSQDLWSFALADLAARSQGETLPKKLVEFVEAFDKALTVDTQSGLDALPPLEPGWERFYEFHLLDRLRSRADLPWPLLKSALAARREGEQAAAELQCASGWSRDKIEIADRLRWEAERLIGTRAASDWELVVVGNLEKARELYKEAVRAVRIVRDAQRLRDRVLGRSRDYLHWRGLSRKDNIDSVPSQADLERLFDAVRRLNLVLASPDKDVVSVQRQFLGLQATVAEVEKGIQEAAIAQLSKADSPGDAWRVKILLGTTLPSADLRLSLFDKLPKASVKRSEEYKFDRDQLQPVAPEPPPISDQSWELAKQQLEAEGWFASLSQCSRAPDINAALAGFDDKDDEARWEALADANQQRAAFYAGLPNAIRTWLQTPGESVEDQLARLRAAAHDLAMVAPRDAASLQDLDLQASIRRGMWFDLLVWHGQRFENAASDAPINEVPWLLAARDGYRGPARRLLADQPLPVYAKNALRLETPSQVDLSSRDQTQKEFEFRLVGTEAPVWIVLQYDKDLLQVRSNENRPDRTYHEHDLGSELRELAKADLAREFAGRSASQADDYPYRPDLFQLPSTLRLPANGAASVKLQVGRSSGADGRATLVVKAIGKDTYIRREIEVVLPPQAMFELLVEGEDRAKSVNRNGDGVVLRPLPNRVQEFAFQIVNATGLQRKVTAALYRTRYDVDVDVEVVLPDGGLPPVAAADLMKRFRPYELLAASELELPATDEPQRVNFPPPNAEEPGPTVAAIAEEDAAGNELPGLAAPHGLLMVITDERTKSQTMRRIQFQARRPRDYLVATATYRDVQERLDIRITASDEDAVPDSGLTVHCEFEGLDPGAEATKEAKLSPPNFEATLSAVAPQGTKVRAKIAVDDYPRAFVFDMNCRVTVLDQGPREDMEAIRIVSPAYGEAYSGAAKVIRARVEVDAPWGSFESQSDQVEVGIDADRDRELEDDASLRLAADRQVEYFVKAIQPDGVLRLNTRAGDFELDLPVRRRNVRAYLLGRLAVGSKNIWSTEAQEPVEVVIDDSPPLIEATTALNPPSRRIPIDGEFEVLIRAADANTEGVPLSGVEKIEVAFDKRKNSFEENKPVLAKRRPADGMWIAKMKAADLEPGNYVVLVRPTDKVGNVEQQRAKLFGIDVVLFRATTAEENAMAVTNVVSGKLFYGKNSFKSLEESEVILTSVANPQEMTRVKIDPQGQFIFPKVAPGKYLLNANAYSANGWRKLEKLQVTVSSNSNTPTRLGDLKLF